MSKPETRHHEREGKLLRGALIELLNARSSLNMQPYPIPKEKQEAYNNGYLSETDYHVAHAVEHLAAVSHLIRRYLEIYPDAE